MLPAQVKASVVGSAGPVPGRVGRAAAPKAAFGLTRPGVYGWSQLETARLSPDVSVEVDSPVPMLVSRSWSLKVACRLYGSGCELH